MTMEVAGDPSVSLVALTCAGRLPLGRRRGRHQPLLGPRHRRADAPHGEPADPVGARSAPRAALRFGILLAAPVVRAAVADRQPAGRGAGARRLHRLRRRVHDVAQAPHAAEHRDRRRGRRDAAAGRLGGDARLAVVDRGLPVRDRLLLDAAPLLGAQPADEGRVRRGGRADAAGGARRGRDAPADRALRGAAVRRQPAAVLRRASSAAIYLAGSMALGFALHRRRRAAVPARRPPLGAAPVPLLDAVPGAAVLRRWSLDVKL